MESAKRRFDAVVFDLDGTLVDSAPDLTRALNCLLEEIGRPALPLTAVLGMIGDGVAKLVERGLAATGGPPQGQSNAALVERFRALYLDRLAVETRPYPGVRETLESLAKAGYALGVCTNKPTAATEALLAALDLGRWFAVVSGGDGPQRKPDPAPLLALLTQLGASPARAVMVGDGINDVLAARAAGMTAVLVSYGYARVPVPELGADRIVDSMTELPALLGDWQAESQ